MFTLLKASKALSMTKPPIILGAIVSLLLLSAMSAQAQVIQLSAKPYEDKPALPFAPPQSPANAQPSLPIASSKAMGSDGFQIEKGKKIDQQLDSFGKQTGWTLVWNAPDYVLDQPMVLRGDFESALIAFLNGANEAGFRLRAVFYRGNKTVRITEN